MKDERQGKGEGLKTSGVGGGCRMRGEGSRERIFIELMTSDRKLKASSEDSKGRI